MTDALLVAGRSLDNYRQYGDAVEPDSHIEPCLICGRQVAIRPEGAARLARGRREGNDPAGVICSPCALHLSPGTVDEVEVTKEAENQMARSPRVREAVEFMRAKTKR